MQTKAAYQQAVQDKHNPSLKKLGKKKGKAASAKSRYRQHLKEKYPEMSDKDCDSQAGVMCKANGMPED